MMEPETTERAIERPKKKVQSHRRRDADMIAARGLPIETKRNEIVLPKRKRVTRARGGRDSRLRRRAVLLPQRREFFLDVRFILAIGRGPQRGMAILAFSRRR